MNNMLTKTYSAGGAIAERRIVKHGASDGVVLQGAAATDAGFGVCVQPGGAASGERCDVQTHGIAQVVCGAGVTRGQLLTSDANGKVITAAAAAGSNVRVVGIADQSGVLDDIIRMLIAPGSFQG